MRHVFPVGTVESGTAKGERTSQDCGAVSDFGSSSPRIRPPGSLADGLRAILRGYGLVFVCRDWRVVDGAAGVEVVDGAGRIVAEFAADADVGTARRALERIAKAYAASIAEAERRAAEDAEWEAMQLAAVVEDPVRLFGDCGGGAGFRAELGFAQGGAR